AVGCPAAPDGGGRPRLPCPRRHSGGPAPAGEAWIGACRPGRRHGFPGRCVMTSVQTPIAAVRPLAEICEAARQATCGECWQVPGVPCTQTPEGDHVARFGRAARRGLISGAELVSVLGRFDAFTTATVVETPGGAR